MSKGNKNIRITIQIAKEHKVSDAVTKYEILAMTVS